MTVIAWDGKTLAADQQATSNDTRRRTVKIRRIATGELLAHTGDQVRGIELERWYEAGAKVEQFPAPMKPDHWARLIVVDKEGAHEYENSPYGARILGKVWAWGSGGDFALGALAMGADSVRAVEIAIEFDTGCGFGVTAVVP